MELAQLRTIVDGLDSLSEIEKVHPKLGAQLLRFVNDVGTCCQVAYDRLSDALAKVRALPPKPTPVEVRHLLQTLNDAPNSTWFKDVANICDRLAVVADRDGPAIREQIRYTSPFGENWADSSSNPGAERYAAHYKITPLLSLLERHERDLKDDIRSIVTNLQSKLGAAKDTRQVEDARAYAVAVQGEISAALDHINQLRLRLGGTSSQGIELLLSTAETALRRPERVLVLNMFFVLFALGLAATVFQYLAVYQFVLATGFAVTIVVVVNALYLKSLGVLPDETFLRLMELALLKFFAPLGGRRSADDKQRQSRRST